MHHRQNIQGFTLLETLVAFAILAISMTVGYMAMSDSFHRQHKQQKILTSLDQAENLMTKIISGQATPKTGDLTVQIRDITSPQLNLQGFRLQEIIIQQPDGKPLLKSHRLSRISRSL